MHNYEIITSIIILACLRMKVKNIDYNFAENKCLIRNQKLLYNYQLLKVSINPLTEKTTMVNNNACYPERSRKALPMNNLALMV